MPTSSFDTPIIIKDDIAAQNLIDAANHYTPIHFIDIERELAQGRAFLKECYSH